MKIYTKTTKIEKCSDCPCRDEVECKSEEGYCCRQYYWRYACIATNPEKDLGYEEWAYPGIKGTYKDEIPEWCPLPDEKLKNKKV